MQEHAPTWIFGYGSLVWRPDFPAVERVPARLDGWVRRFWQGSPDHRGTPERPGRVVTLLRQADAVVHGVVYRLRPGSEAETLARLDVREVAGYALHRLPLRLGDGRRLTEALVYVATEDNRWFQGPAPLADIAAQVVGCAGRSGPNRDYVLRLDAALRGMGVYDGHVASLAAQVRASSAPPGP